MNAILVFAKAPKPGQVKTRLAAHIGHKNAARFYVALLKDTLQVAQNAAAACQAEVIVCYTPQGAFAEGDFSLFPFWQGRNKPQNGADLGEKMRFALQNSLENSAERALLIGSDMPDLKVEILCEAFDKLTTHDLVFGPSEDGGFYLIGARVLLPDCIFDNVIWSHDSTLRTVLHNARAANLSVALLPAGADIDEWRDLQNFVKNSQNSSAQNAPHFRAALAELNLL